jgi:hypothetical protein
MNGKPGITKYYETPDLAYSDFVKSWKPYKGFEWIEKNH